MEKLLTSRRLWVFILSQLVAIGLFTATNFIPDPKMLELARMSIGFVDGLAAIVIGLYTADDMASNITAIRAGSHPEFQGEQKVVTKSK